MTTIALRFAPDLGRALPRIAFEVDGSSAAGPELEAAFVVVDRTRPEG